MCVIFNKSNNNNNSNDDDDDGDELKLAYKTWDTDWSCQWAILTFTCNYTQCQYTVNINVLLTSLNIQTPKDPPPKTKNTQKTNNNNNNKQTR